MGIVFNPITSNFDITSDPSASGVDSVNGRTGPVVLTKSDVGLSNVDNTSDANKPISTATQTAIDNKVSKAGDTMSGDLSMGGGVVAVTGGTTLLLNMEGASVIDSSDLHNSLTVTGATLSSSQAKFGTKSLYFVGNNQEVVAPNSVGNFGANDFTFECWINQSVAGNKVVQNIMSKGDGIESHGINLCVYFDQGFTNQSYLRVAGSVNSQSWGIDLISDAVNLVNKWTHVAVVRTNGFIKLYIDGQVNTNINNNAVGTNPLSISNTEPFLIGNSTAWGLGNSFEGYIDDVRVTEGYALYTSNFTPPTAQLTAIPYQIAGSVNYKITNLKAGTATNDAVNKGQLDTKLNLSGGTMTGDIIMNNHRVTGLPVPLSSDEVATKGFVEGLATGVVFYDPIIDPDLVDDSLNAPPVTIIPNVVYIIGTSPTGDWTGLARHAVFYDSHTSSWIDLLDRPVGIGDRFGAAMEYATSGSINGQPSGTYDNQILEITAISPLTYEFTVPVTGRSVFVANEKSTHLGHAYNWNGTAWVEFLGPGALVAGDALAWDANTLNVQTGNGITVNGSNQLELALDGTVPVTAALNFQANVANNLGGINNTDYTAFDVTAWLGTSITTKIQNIIRHNEIGTGTNAENTVLHKDSSIQLVYPFTITNPVGIEFTKFVYNNLKNISSSDESLNLIISSANNTLPENIIAISNAIYTGSISNSSFQSVEFLFPDVVFLDQQTYYFYLDSGSGLLELSSLIYTNIGNIPSFILYQDYLSPISLDASEVNFNNTPIINAYIPDAVNPNDPVNKAQLDAAIIGGGGSGGSAGDLIENSFSLANDQSVFANITGFHFDNVTARSFKALVSVEIFADSDFYQVSEIIGIQKDAGWQITQISTGDDTGGIIFNITNAGQLQYATANFSGFISGKIKFRAQTTTIG